MNTIKFSATGGDAPSSRKKTKQPAGADKAARDVSRAMSPSLSIVGIGESAGGLEAYTRLLQHLSANTGMGFVLVQHLD